MASESVLVLGALLATVLLISTEAAARELAEQPPEKKVNKAGVEEHKYRGGGYGGYPGGGYGGYPGGGYRGYPGGGYGGYPGGGYGGYPGGGYRGGGYTGGGYPGGGYPGRGYGGYPGRRIPWAWPLLLWMLPTWIPWRLPMPHHRQRDARF